MKHIEKETKEDYIYLKGALEAGKNLKIVMSSLTRITEKNKSSTTGKLHYSHPKLSPEYNSLKRHISCLFTYNNQNVSI